MKARIFASLLLLFSLIAQVPVVSAGAPAAGLETRLERPAKIWVGQRLDLNITLYTSGTFSGVPRFDLPKESGMLIMGDHDRPLLGSRESYGVSKLSAQYTVTLFPLQAGNLEVPAFKVEFAYRGENRREVPVTLCTTPQRFSVLAVPGADSGLPLVTCIDLKVTDRWNPRPGKAKVGDAFTRTVTMIAEGLPGMALPPLQPASLDGLAVYPTPPLVSTDTERGSFTGKRQESYSYVFEKPGRYSLPAIQLQWWNPQDEVLKIFVLKGVSFDVAPNPLLQGGDSSSMSHESGRPRWVGAMGILTAQLLSGIRSGRRMRSIRSSGRISAPTG